MYEIVINVEVNMYWLKEQQEKGEIPFAQVQTKLMESYPNLKISVNENKMAIKNVTQEQNAEIRKKIKEIFYVNYKMSISDGDYILSARVYPVYDDKEDESKTEEGSAEEVQEEKKEDKEESKEESKGESREESKEESREESKEESKEKKKEEDTKEKKEDEQKVNPPDEIRPKDEKVSSQKEEGYLSVQNLENFLSEFDQIIKNAKKYKIPEVMWSTNVLLSMDSGYGVTTVNDRIAKVLEQNGCSFLSKTQKQIVEYEIPGEYDLVDKYWAHMLEEIERHYTDEKNNKKRTVTMPFIFCIDLSECISAIGEKKIHENLQKLSKIKGSFLFVFRVPYIEEFALNKVKEVLEDMFLIRQVVIPPMANEELVIYLKRQLERKQIEVSNDLDIFLEKLIAEEKRDGHFQGLKSIKRLAMDILYNKLSAAGEEDKLTLTQQDLYEHYSFLDEEESNPEDMLSKLCGMENVKQTIDEIVAQIQMYRDLKKEGKKLSAPTMHMRFVGNPGTGKTTVARLVAQIFRERGILNKGYFYEIKARDLCGRYVGETAPKTSSYCTDALGSVLFIDEAYTLYRGKGSSDYGKEAIETLITEMENNRDNLVVIMAGYKEEMDELLEMNSGLASRMPYEISFRNYTKEELIDIFYRMVGENFSYSDGFDQALRDFILSIPDEVLGRADFGNARMIRNLYERIWSKAAYRRSVSGDKEIILQEDDVQRAIVDEEFRQLLTKKSKKIGF